MKKGGKRIERKKFWSQKRGRECRFMQENLIIGGVSGVGLFGPGVLSRACLGSCKSLQWPLVFQVCVSGERPKQRRSDGIAFCGAERECLPGRTVAQPPRHRYGDFELLLEKFLFI